MRYVIGILAVFAAIALGVWLWMSRPDAASPRVQTEAHIAKFETQTSRLLDEKYIFSGGSALDVDGLIEQLPEKWALAYDGLNFDEATGATTLSGVEITHADLNGAVLNIDKMSTWGFDVDLLKARLGGQRLGETASIIDRVDLSGIEVTGLDNAYQPLIDSALDTMDNINSEDIDLETTIEEYNFKLGRMVIDKASVHPWSWDPLTAEKLAHLEESIDAEDLEVMHLLQKFAAFARSYSIDAVAVENMSTEMAMTQMGFPSSIKFVVARGGYTGIDRGNIASAIVRDMEFSGATVMPDFSKMSSSDFEESEDPTAFMKSMPMSGSVALYSVENVRMSKLFEHGAQGKWPEASDTDFMSLGIFTGKNIVYALDTKPFYSMETVRYDLSGFHGLAPTKIDMKVDNLTYHLDAVMEMFAPGLQSIPDVEEEVAVITDIFDVLEKYDLSEPSIDLHLGWVWDEDKGVGSGQFAYGIDGMSRVETMMEVQTPTYDEMMPHLKFTGDLPVDGDALTELFELKSGLRAASWRVKDEGGIDKVLSLIPEIAAVIPDPSPQIEVMANYEPETLRQMAVASVQLMSGEVNKEAPQLTPLFDGMVKLIKEGGSLNVRIDPPQPLTSQLFDSLNPQDLPPEKRLDVIGLTATHTSP